MDTLNSEGIKQSTGIEGVFLQSLNIVANPKGCVLHMLRSEYALMPDLKAGFGEIYFSEVLPGSVKAWKKHTRQTQLFAVPFGLLTIVLYDQRPNSKTKAKILELLLGRPDHYALLRIPPGIWYGFATKSQQALICNYADLPHDPTECERKDWQDPTIPYAWSNWLKI